MKHKTIVLLVLALLLFCASPANAGAICPEKGSGYDGVQWFVDECKECDEKAITCNEEFSIELLAVEREDHLVTFTYKVCNLSEDGNNTALGGDGGDEDGEDGDRNCLKYWILDISELKDCLGKEFCLCDLVVDCSVGENSVDDCYCVELDEKTQLTGIKFFAEICAGECEIFTVTLDESKLNEGFKIGTGCVVAATVAGYQDIRNCEKDSPGYACVKGPVCKEKKPDKFICPRTQGYWKNHPDAWPVETLVLGDETYNQQELLALLKSSVKGDASIILAKQLIAAKLNIAAGSDPDPIEDVIEDADDLLDDFSGKLPYGVSPSSGAGKEMVDLAEMLDDYNEGLLTFDCEKDEDENDYGNKHKNKNKNKGKDNGKGKHNGKNGYGRWRK